MKKSAPAKDKWTPVLRWTLLGCALLGASPALPQIVGPTTQVMCGQSVVMEAGPTTTQKIMAGQPGKRIYVCGWHITNTAATGTFQILTGTTTTTPCDTNPVKVTPVSNVTSTAPSADHIDYAVAQGAVGADLCFTPSVATVAATIWVGQY